jgi:hypothetical protein
MFIWKKIKHKRKDFLRENRIKSNGFLRNFISLQKSKITEKD